MLRCSPACCGAWTELGRAPGHAGGQLQQFHYRQQLRLGHHMQQRSFAERLVCIPHHDRVEWHPLPCPFPLPNQDVGRLGRSYDSQSQTIQANGQCVDGSNKGELQLQPCTGSPVSDFLGRPIPAVLLTPLPPFALDAGAEVSVVRQRPRVCERCFQRVHRCLRFLWPRSVLVGRRAMPLRAGHHGLVALQWCRCGPATPAPTSSLPSPTAVFPTATTSASATAATTLPVSRPSMPFAPWGFHQR